LIRAIQKFAIEVKTTEGTQIALAHKDVTGLRAKSEHDGYIPAVAELRLGYSSDWIVCNAQRLTVGKYACSRLALDSMPELEVAVTQHFERTVSEFKRTNPKTSQRRTINFLNSILIAENMPAVPVEVLRPVSVTDDFEII
jgi:hypothetical protein